MNAASCVSSYDAFRRLRKHCKFGDIDPDLLNKNLVGILALKLEICAETSIDQQLRRLHPGWSRSQKKIVIDAAMFASPEEVEAFAARFLQEDIGLRL